MTNYYGIKVGLAQINPTVGDLTGNRDKIINYINQAEEKNCDFVLFPEMSVTGYPVQDLIFIHDFVDNNLKVLDSIKEHVHKTTAILGCITKVNGGKNSLTPYHNSAAIIAPNQPIKFIHKHLLPNYDVFDEKRYFAPSEEFSVVDFNGLKIGVEICEDLWDDQYTTKVTKNLKNLGANCIFNINASPYYIEKPEIRENLITGHIKKESIPLVYLNMVGGQDEITFDGRSVAFDSNGTALLRMPSFKEDFAVVDIPVPTEIEIPELKDRIIRKTDLPTKSNGYEINDTEEMFKALSMNLRDYYTKVGIFKKIVLGLSGGIDSTLTAAVACDAVGAENVVGILMPSKFSSDHSVNDAVELANNLGMEYIIVPIKEIHQIYEKVLWNSFNINEFSLADENLQSRLRGIILMYYSNKFGALLVSTGNKSEIATGYCTLYGDTNGGKNVPGDLYKRDVYNISRWINENAKSQGKPNIIPLSSIEKPPSAELRPNQTDQDSLPPYDLLDDILIEFIENDKGIHEIIAMGYDEMVVKRIERLYYNTEFKRAQLVQTIKLTKKGFGIGRRLPVINKYHLNRDKI